MSARSKLFTLVIVAIYAAVMAYTNGVFTVLDDESTIVAVAGHPVLPTLTLFLSGGGQHEHPPLSDIILHLWLVMTNYSFFTLRVFANIFYILGIWLASMSAGRVGGKKAYWATLVLGFVWPFSFQYGRITGWYCVCMFLISLLTWLYLRILEERGYWSWASFTIVSILMVWSNYFGVAILLLLVVDFMMFHRILARKNTKPLLISAAVIAVSFLPLLHVVLTNVGVHTARIASDMNWKGVIATVGYPLFSIFGSVAVAPWFLPLSIPVFVFTIVLLVSIWFSRGRRWLVYFILSMILLGLSGHMDVKRVLFLLPWLYLAMGVAASSGTSRYSKLASAAIAVIVIVGWAGIISGKHYATSNLYEPWGRVAQFVAGDARRGATVISENPPFYLYLDYQLDLEHETGNAPTANLGERFYLSHGYKIYEPDENNLQLLAETLRGKVVLVNGSADKPHVLLTNALDRRLRQRCRTLGEYRATPDPAAALKDKFAKNAPVLVYRTVVTWYDCSNEGR